MSLRRFEHFSGERAQIYYLPETIPIEKSWEWTQDVNCAANIMNQLVTYCGNAHLQEMYGLYAVGGFRSVQMRLRTFLCYFVWWWEDVLKLNWKNGPRSPGHCGMLEINFILRRSSSTQERSWMAPLDIWQSTSTFWLHRIELHMEINLLYTEIKLAFFACITRWFLLCTMLHFVIHCLVWCPLSLLGPVGL